MLARSPTTDKNNMKNSKTTIRLATVVAALLTSVGGLSAQQVFRNTITGEALDLNEAPEQGRDTEAVKEFLKSGRNLYVENKSCLKKGEEDYLVACSGCHGHLAEGKVGPGLNDSYWTYPKNKSSKGLFETIFGGAQGMMGPHGSSSSLDEILLIEAWIRHLYTGDVEEADWLTDEQKKTFKPYKEHGSSSGAASKGAAADEVCKVSAP